MISEFVVELSAVTSENIIKCNAGYLLQQTEDQDRNEEQFSLFVTKELLIFI